jgi:hypothetical protein
LWTEAKYPGDRVRTQPMHRDGEIGEVCIQLYENVVRVASFLPGIYLQLEGDTPKTAPEKQMHYRHADPADAMFDQYVQEAYAAGWQNYQHGALK